MRSVPGSRQRASDVEIQPADTGLRSKQAEKAATNTHTNARAHASGMQPASKTALVLEQEAARRKLECSLARAPPRASEAAGRRARLTNPGGRHATGIQCWRGSAPHVRRPERTGCRFDEALHAGLRSQAARSAPRPIAAIDCDLSSHRLVSAVRAQHRRPPGACVQARAERRGLRGGGRSPAEQDCACGDETSMHGTAWNSAGHRSARGTKRRAGAACTTRSRRAFSALFLCSLISGQAPCHRLFEFPGGMLEFHISLYAITLEFYKKVSFGFPQAPMVLTGFRFL